MRTPFFETACQNFCCRPSKFRYGPGRFCFEVAPAEVEKPLAGKPKPEKDTTSPATDAAKR